jgi:hypothetical protein
VRDKEPKAVTNGQNCHVLVTPAIIQVGRRRLAQVFSRHKRRLKQRSRPGCHENRENRQPGREDRTITAILIADHHVDEGVPLQDAYEQAGMRDTREFDGDKAKKLDPEVGRL